jgi:hypothetical protein
MILSDDRLSRLMVVICKSVRLFFYSVMEIDYFNGLRDQLCGISTVNKLLSKYVINLERYTLK